MNKPNFIILGAAKSGTTSLYKYLSQHPNIYMSSQKELNFFAFDGEHFNSDGAADREGKQRYNYLKKISITNIQAYQEQFEGVKNEQAIGEASPLYLYSPRVAPRIYRYQPNIKLIAIFRNPIERAYSHLAYQIARNHESITDFDLVVKQEPITVNNIWYGSRHYVRLGYYYSQIKRYYELFEPSCIKIYLYEQLVNKPQEMLKNIFNFLEVDSTFLPNTKIKYNQSVIPKNRKLHNLIASPSPLKSSLKKKLSPRLIEVITNLKKRNLVKVTPSLKPETEKYLRSIYREDILQLQDLIQQDLSHWLN